LLSGIGAACRVDFLRALTLPAFVKLPYMRECAWALVDFAVFEMTAVASMPERETAANALGKDVDFFGTARQGDRGGEIFRRDLLGFEIPDAQLNRF
jgi:hypothetical protein